MGYPPVVVVESGGVPRTQVAEGVSAPAYTVVESGARAITLTDNAPPIALFNPDGSHYSGGEASPMAILIALHQSNNTGGQDNAQGATLVSPADDAQAGLYEWSPNGGGAYSPGGADATPSFARMLNAQATAQLRWSSGIAGETTYPRASFSVGPTWSFMKAFKAAHPTQDMVVIPGGIGGTDTTEYRSNASVSTNWPANRYNVLKTAYDTLKAAHPNTSIFAFTASVLENEIANNRAGVGADKATVETYVTGVFTNWLNDMRALGGTGAATAPFILSTPLPEWISAQGEKYLLGLAKWATTVPYVGIIRRRRGYSTSGDTIHMTNVGNRIHGPEMYDARARIIAQTEGPIAAPTVTLDGETLLITSNGANYYEVWTRAAGSGGAYTKYEYCPKEFNIPGEVFRVTIPGTGDRDAYVVAKAYGGDGTSSVLNYVVPNPSMPTPVVALDFDTATVDGSQNLISVPSLGSDTGAWTPSSSAGTGATASLKRTLIGSKYGIILDALTKNLLNASFTQPAGDYSIVAPIFFNTQTAGQIYGNGTSGTATDIHYGLRDTGSDFALGHNTTGVQLLTTDNPTRSRVGVWRMFAVTYVRASNTYHWYIDEEDMVLPGTLTQRAASPSSPGGSRFYGSGLSSASGGWSGATTYALPPKTYSVALSTSQLQKLKSQYSIDHAINFGVLPVAA